MADTFDKEKFMEKEWARLAAYYGVSVEEVKSKEFDELLERQDEARRTEEEKLNLAETHELRKDINIGTAAAAILGFVVLLVLRPNKFWICLLAGVVSALVYIFAAWSAVESVKKSNYDKPDEYWKNVRNALGVFNQAVIVTIFASIMFAVVVARI